MKEKNNLIKLVILTLIVTTIAASQNNQERINTNNKSILGKYIENCDLQKIIADYSLELEEAKVIDLKYHITSAKIRNDNEIVIMRHVNPFESIESCKNNKDTWCPLPSYLFQVFDLESFKCKDALNYGSIWDTNIIAHLIGYFIFICQRSKNCYVIGVRTVGKNSKISSDGKRITVNSHFYDDSSPNETWLFNTENNNLINKFKHSADRDKSFYEVVRCLKDNKHIAFIKHNRDIEIYNIEKSHPILKSVINLETFTEEFCTKYIEFIKDDNNVIAYSDKESLLLIKNIDNAKDTIKLKFDEPSIKAFTFSDNGKYFATSSERGIKLWNEDVKCVGTLSDMLKEEEYLDEYSPYYFSHFTLLAFSKDLKYLAAYKPGLIKLWDISSGRHIQTLNIDNDSRGTSLLFSANDKYLILAAESSMYSWLNRAYAITHSDPLPQNFIESNQMRNSLCSVQ